MTDATLHVPKKRDIAALDLHQFAPHLVGMLLKLSMKSVTTET